MTFANYIDISRIENGYVISINYTINSKRLYCETEEHVIAEVALALSNNIDDPDKVLEVKTNRVEIKDYVNNVNEVKKWLQQKQIS